jgi:hypothetical protein
LGNLILLDQKTNSEIGIRPLAEKVQILAEKGYILPATITKTNDWGPVESIAHTENLATLCYEEIWNI